MNYGMFTHEGNKAVAEAIAEVCTAANLPDDEDDREAFSDLIDEICETVQAEGQGQVNKSKYANDKSMIEGFDEVRDTAVREAIYDAIIDLIDAQQDDS
jgi:hypothetical protein